MFPFVIRLDPDETLYSFAATIHRVNGSARAEETSQRLFGTRRAMRQHDFPANSRMRAANLCFGEAESLTLLRRHTVAAYYWPFADPARLTALESEAPSAVLLMPYKELGVASRTLVLSHPLKWCRHCIIEDRERLGRPIWRVEHQFPTTWLCLKHDAALNWHLGRHHKWLLPGDLRRTNAPPALAPCDASRALVEVGSQLRALGRVDLGLLRIEAIQRLRDLGVIHNAQTAWHGRLVQWFGATKMSALLRSSSSALRSLEQGEWIATQLFGRKSNHAVRWAVLWAAIGMECPGGAASTFADAAAGLRRRPDGQLCLFDDLPNPYRAPDRVWACMGRANSYEQAMLELNASRHDIWRWLASDAALRSMWKARLRDERLDVTKKRLRAYLLSHPEASSGDLEADNGADVQWLCINAPDALRAIRRGLTPRAAPQRDLFERMVGR